MKINSDIFVDIDKVLSIVALPKITNEPMNITTSRDDTVYFNVTAISGEEFVYRWQRDGSDLIETRDKLEGVNSSVLTIRGVRNDDEGDYRCTICNSAGDCVKSDRAYLLVSKLPTMKDCLSSLNKPFLNTYS